jgi:hypothetical protein
VNDEIKELMKKRDRLHRVARKTNNICDWDSFRVARNEVMKTLQRKKNDSQKTEGDILGCMSKMKFTKIKNRM